MRPDAGAEVLRVVSAEEPALCIGMHTRGSSGAGERVTWSGLPPEVVLWVMWSGRTGTRCLCAATGLTVIISVICVFAVKKCERSSQTEEQITRLESIFKERG